MVLTNLTIPTKILEGIVISYYQKLSFTTLYKLIPTIVVHTGS
jgi:hypothetical protein